LNLQIIIGMSLGIVLGGVFISLGSSHAVTHWGLYICGLGGHLFTDLLKMLMVPLVLTSICVGVANLRQHHQIQRVWRYTLLCFVVSMMLAIVLGLSAMQVLQIGKGVNLAMLQAAPSSISVKQLTLSEFLAHFLQGLFVNPFSALAQGNILAIVMFALLLGVALVVGGDRYKNILLLLQESLELILHMVSWVMRLAPFGIMALFTQLVASQDLSLLSSMESFVAMVISTTLIHGLLVLPGLLWLITGMSPLRFLSGAREALATALATSSSSATLPVTLRCVERQLHVQPAIAGFVVPLGATLNMDGTALYEAAAALFVANLCGLELDITQQLIVSLTAMFAAMGAPGIPSAGMVTMVMVLQSVGLPAEAIAILLPIDRLLDTVRTMVNVEGDMVTSIIVQRWLRGPK
jgi:Na+/H+-dicarboxylate symporter